MIHLERRNTVTVLRLEHGKVSALDSELLGTLVDRLTEIEQAPYGPIVLTGTGTSFSAGVDLWRVLKEGDAYLDNFLPTITTALTRLFTVPRPVVAAVNGHAIAGGCVLVCACDYRIMAEGSGVIGVPELRVGVPFPGAAIEILRFATGGADLQQLVYLGRNYAAAEARELRLIDEVVAPDALLARACEVAEGLAAIPPRTFQLNKRQLRQASLDRIAWHASVTDTEFAQAWADPAIQAAVRAYMEATVRRRRDH